MSARWTPIIIAAGLLAGCANSAGVTEPAGMAQLSPVEVEAPDATEAKRDAWNCEGTLVPPNGWAQASAFVDAAEAGATARANESARRQLLDRLCGGSSNCDGLEARISLWKTGAGAGKVCAMAVIETAELEAWRRATQTLDKLEQGLSVAARELLVGRKKPVVIIDKIVDGAIAGGPRAQWLSSRMTRALTGEGASVKEIPRGWNGQGLPRGITMVVEAIAVTRNEAQNAVIEVVWSVRERGASGLERRVAAPVIFPADAAPRTQAGDALPTSSGDLSVRIESQVGGSLCLGGKTQLWLYSKREMHVRVFDLYGEEGALLLFPNGDHPDGLIRAGETLALGGEAGFEAVPAPGSEVERFLVIAAPTPQGLGRFRTQRGYCRVPAQMARRLHRGEAIPTSATAVSDSFRLVSGGRCPPPPDEKVRAEQARGLDALPLCPL